MTSLLAVLIEFLEIDTDLHIVLSVIVQRDNQSFATEHWGSITIQVLETDGG